ncbi:MAG: hypothetical protein M1839_004381 [Geoglossum umbratile]|nr:MAG: hypothetical protein M1839_004381 [Geoglossum umbratile]
MSLAVALQSVLYFVLSCQPCRNVAHERRRARQAALDNQEKARMAMEEPDTYAHPAPFSTNIYWQEEINLGPGPPPQRLTRAERKRKLNNKAPGSSGYVSPEGMHTPTGEKAGGINWNRQRYHREDEPLWGRDILHDIRDEGGATPAHRALSGSSVGLPGVKTSNTATTYHYTLRNPPVNEYHPPIVSTPPLHRSETFWMLQPPPSPSVMAGKVPASRCQAGNGHKRPEDLRRRVSERLTAERAQLGESSSSELDPQYMHGHGELQTGEVQNGAPQDASSQDRNPQERALSVAFPSGGSTEGRRKQKRRPAPIEISEDSGVSESPIQLPPPALAAPSLSSQRSRLKRHSDSSFLDVKISPLVHDVSASSPRRSPLLSRSTDQSSNSVESYSTAPEAPHSLAIPTTDLASQILQEIGSPNYVLVSRPISPHLAEPRVPSPVARREMLFRNEIRLSIPETGFERRDNRSASQGDAPLKSSRSAIVGSLDTVNIYSATESRRLSLTMEGLTVVF